MLCRILACILCIGIFGVAAASINNELLLVTIATDENDGLRRYLRSVKKNNLETKVFGLGEKWEGGNMEAGVGGGHKVNLLRRELEAYKDRDDLIIMFTDSYDVVITAGAEEILEKFEKFDARVVISAEGFIWPDKSLMYKYPQVKLHEKRFLCSGGFIGYAKDLYEIVSHKAIENTYDDQLYYTEIFLDESLREKWSIKLDKRSEIFMNLHGALGEIMLKYKGSHSFLYNVKTGTVPIVIHGNGPIKPEFNRLANYLADSWTLNSGCMACAEHTISFDGLSVEDYPTVLLGIFIEQPTPFLKEFLEKVAALDYPKEKIDIFIHSTVAYHQKTLKPFIDGNAKAYKSLAVLNPSDGIPEKNGRNWALKESKNKDCQYFFSVDADAHLDNDQTLKLMIQQNRSVLAAMITRKGKTWSTFWGALSETGFYARSEDYMDIVHYDKFGLWNVPYMSGVYLIHGYIVPSILEAYSATPTLDADMSLCKALRDKGIFMYVSNTNVYGHLVNTEGFDQSHTNNELYEIFNNPHDWEQRYIHPDYAQALKEDSHIEQPCPDVFWFPIVTDAFCDELIEEMENFGQWSGGKNEDARLAGGYENVPTDDIHMTQVGFEKHWLQFLKDYVAALATRVYPGYYSNDPRVGGYESVPTDDVHLSQIDLHDQWLQFLEDYVAVLTPVVYSGYQSEDDTRISSGFEYVPTDDIHLSQVGMHDAWLKFLSLFVKPLQLRVYPGYHDPPRAQLNFVVKYHPERQKLLRPHHDSSTFTINIALNTPHKDYEGGGCRFLRYNCSVTDSRKGWMLMHPGRLTHYHEGLQTTAGTRYIMVSFVDP